MATILEAFGTTTAFTITNININSSATSGWQSNSIDNSTNLYDDALVEVSSTPSGSPANSKAIFIFAFASLDGGTVWTSTGAAVYTGTEGSGFTFPDITTTPCVAPLLGIIPYTTTAVAHNGGPWSVARCFGGILPPKWGIGLVNHSGQALASSTAKYTEVKYTVA